MSSVYLGLGQPSSDILSKLELSNIIQRRLSLRLESVRQSEQGIAVAKSAEFTLAAGADEIDLTTTITDFVIPMWVEAQTVQYLSNPVWMFVPTVNISMLQQYRAEASPAVAFYGDNPRQVKAKFSYFGEEILPNSRTYQVWYLPEMTFPTTEDGQIELPENLVNILTYDAYVSAIPIMKMNMAKQLTKRPDLAAQMTVLAEMYQHYSGEQKEFEKWFTKWATESRGGHRPRNRRDVLSWMGSGVRRVGYWGGGS